VAIAIPLSVVGIAVPVALPAFVFEHLMVLLVVALAVGGGRGPAITAAVAGSIGDNVLLREPVGSPAITGVRDVVDFGLFITVAIVVGWLVGRLRIAREHAVHAAERERRIREERDRLVATVTHDLATPLTAIQGTIQFARKFGAVSEVDPVRLLARIETAAAHATSLVRALQDSRSIEEQSLSLDLRLVSVQGIVEPIVKMLDEASDRHPIVLAMDPAPLVVRGDAERLGRVVENLITNAIKYSPGGGAIEVCVQEESSNAVLTVRDHGIGIGESSPERLFELGYRAPAAVGVAPGLGLGLYIAAEMVRRHGGAIAAATVGGGGTLFAVRLPLVKPPLTEMTPNHDNPTPDAPAAETVH
jgi:signal transduction histidine kinase